MNRIEYKKLGETVYTTTLENGLPIFVVQKKGFNKKFAFFITRYGGSERRFKYNGEWLDTPAGVAHFLEHKLFETEDGNALTILTKNGATVNAYTSTGVTAYHAESTENFDENLESLLSFVSIPYFTKESVDKEQGIIGQEIVMIADRPTTRVYQNLMEALFQYNPVRESIAGSIESIAEITAEVLYSCHKVFYNPSNMALCVVGDVDPEMVVEIAKKVLPEEKGGPGERDYGPPESLLPVKREVSANMPVATPRFLMGCKMKPSDTGKARAEQIWAGDLALSLIVGPSSPLYSRLYTQGLINQSFGFRVQYFPEAAVVLFAGESQAPKKVEEAIKEEIAAFIQNGPDSALFARQKKANIGECLRSLNSFKSIAAGVTDAYFSGYDYFETVDLLSNITEEQVWAFAKETFSEDRFALSTVHP